MLLIPLHRAIQKWIRLKCSFILIFFIFISWGDDSKDLRFLFVKIETYSLSILKEVRPKNLRPPSSLKENNNLNIFLYE